jgi:hypothetical protein
VFLGVIDLPYVEAPEPPRKVAQARKGKQRPRGKKTPPEAGTRTTGDVAEILEGKYHVMETFYDLHEEEIAEDFAESTAGALEDLLLGAPPRDPLAGAASKVEDRFHRFLELKEMDETSTPGVPTRASLRGVNHRLKIRRGAPRPSFIDTGLYDSSFKVTTETDQ